MTDLLQSLRVLDRKAVIELLGVSPRTFDRMLAAGDAPPSIKLSARRIGWRLGEIQTWQDGRGKTQAAA